MWNFLESLSLVGGSFLVASLSVIALLVAIRALPSSGQWLVGLAAPFGISYVIYRLPVWRGANPSEYSAWLWLAVGVWAAAGLLANSAVAFGLAINRRRHANQAGPNNSSKPTPLRGAA